MYNNILQTSPSALKLATRWHKVDGARHVNVFGPKPAERITCAAERTNILFVS